MKNLAVLLGGLLFLPLMSSGAQTAQARLFCLSVRFHQGTDMNGLSTLDLSTLGLDAPNGELAPTFSSPDHFSFFRQFDKIFEEILQEGEIDFNTPAFSDANDNGFDDFFEVSQPVSGVATGSYGSPVDSGTVQATWRRSAGSKDGTCVLRLTSQTFGLLGNYTHTFELIEYAGAMTYTPAAMNVTGAVLLSQTGDPANQLAGPVIFAKSSTNRFNELELQPGGWTNVAGLSLVFTNDIFFRDELRLTNYFGFVDFDDGDPNTPNAADYFTWFLSIDDVNDTNHNGIPDFSDDVGETNTRAPLLTLARGNTNLLLSISGTVGRKHEIQGIASLSQTNWATVEFLTLTNDPQIVSLPLPTNATSFWRVSAP